MIDFLKEDEIFVFGSNIQGRHGAGAAKQAMQWGAIYGKPSGRQGQTYAIITKDLRDNSFVGWDFVREQLAILMKYAHINDDLTFLLTPIGTGLAGQTIEDLEHNIRDFYFPDNIVKMWPQSKINKLKPEEKQEIDWSINNMNSDCTTEIFKDCMDIFNE